jgi:DMSO/TMAO reductase YedYZ heme-binding membrane subunit
VNFFSANISFVVALFLYALIHLFNRWVHRHNGWIFLGSLILSTSIMFVNIPILSDVIDSGHVSLAFFMLVMVAGVLPKTNLAYKKIFLVRGDFAILGFIYLLPHGIMRLSLALYGYNPSGLIAAIIMIPLTMSSFMIIRKKIRPDRWKKLHQLAYLTYLLIYIHLGFDISLHPSNMYIIISPNSLLFHLFFIGYFVLKMMVIIKKKKRLPATSAVESSSVK